MQVCEQTCFDYTYWTNNLMFLHSVISLTECIGIVRVGKYRVVCLCCVSVCVCVWLCVSSRARMPKLPSRFQQNLPQIVFYISCCVCLSFSSLTYSTLRKSITNKSHLKSVGLHLDVPKSVSQKRQSNNVLIRTTQRCKFSTGLG